MAYDFTRLKFLIVEDNRYMRSIFRELLGAFGLRSDNICDCADGSEALTILASFQADIAIVDYLMTPMDGIAFSRHVRTDEDSPNKYLPIILCTGFTEHDRVVEARDAGVNEVLAKPVDATTLYNRIVSLVEHPRPYTKQPDFFGPDRRRRFDEEYEPKREDDSVEPPEAPVDLPIDAGPEPPPDA